MEMPNTQPPAFTQRLLEDKYEIAQHTSLANYSFYMGTSNDNYDEVMRTNEKAKKRLRRENFHGFINRKLAGG
jgi:dihydroorotase